jgi:tRNA(Ile)-lysidine synthase
MHHDSGRAAFAAARRAAREVDAPLLLAVSGGLDSMALLHAAAAVARSRIAVVATFDHGTGRAASAAAAHVARTATSLGLPVVVGHLGAGRGSRPGSEAAWRQARYEFLRSAAAPLGARIVTAHTEDDQVETVLMRAMRGSGVRGLAGLYAASEIVRPFIGLRRANLAAYARDAGITWHDDPSNDSPAFLRNRVRRDLLPALRRADAAFDVTLLELARRAAAWRAELDTLVNTGIAARIAGRGALLVPRAELAGLDGDSLAVLWGAMAGRAGLALDRRGTRRLAAFTMTDRSRGSIPLSGGWRLDASATSYLLHRPAPELAPSALPRRGEVEWGGFRFRPARGAAVSRLAADRVWTAALPAGDEAVVRAWMPGDRLAPAAGQQRRRVKRYLSDAGVRGADRRNWPVVVSGDDVVWIPGVRRSDAATVRSGRPVRHYVCERIDR